jgi:hypothetical protein
MARRDAGRREWPIVPREGFLVLLFAVDEAVERIRDGTITGDVYEPQTARLT